MNYLRGKLSEDEMRAVIAAIQSELDVPRVGKKATALAIFLTLYGVPQDRRVIVPEGYDPRPGAVIDVN